MTKKKIESKAERFVLVTTAQRGVFAGYATDTTGETIFLRRGRNALYWGASVRGFVGLAGPTGPDGSCRIGPPADMTLRNITAVLECTEAAREAWERGAWC